MHQPDQSIFHGSELLPTRRRQDMLPLWLKIGSWIVLVILPVFTVILIIGTIADLTGISKEVNFDDYKGTRLFFLLLDIFLLILKTSAAFGLLKEKNWGVSIGIADAIAGLSLLSISLLFPRLLAIPFHKESLGLVYVVVICPFALYLFTLYRVRDEWRENIFARQQILNPQNSINV